MELGQQLELLLGNFTHLNSRIRHLAYDTTACGDRIEVRCSYVSFQAGVQTIDEFIDVLVSHIVGAVAELVGIEGGVVSEVINLESSGVEASDWRLRHDQAYHEA